MYFLGYDLGSSSIKACLFDAERGRGVAHATYPDEEMPIDAPRAGWAEQDPQSWWEAAKAATERVLASVSVPSTEIGGIGISYQMHGLVIVDESGAPLRPSIIWCDSRAVAIGDAAFASLGAERCLGSASELSGELHRVQARVGARERARRLRARRQDDAAGWTTLRSSSPAALPRRCRASPRVCCGISPRARRRSFCWTTTVSRRRWWPRTVPTFRRAGEAHRIGRRRARLERGNARRLSRRGPAEQRVVAERPRAGRDRGDRGDVRRRLRGERHRPR